MNKYLETTVEVPSPLMKIPSFPSTPSETLESVPGIRLALWHFWNHFLCVLRDYREDGPVRILERMNCVTLVVLEVLEKLPHDEEHRYFSPCFSEPVLDMFLISLGLQNDRIKKIDSHRRHRKSFTTVGYARYPFILCFTQERAYIQHALSNCPVKAVRPAWAALAPSLDHSSPTQSPSFQLSLSKKNSLAKKKNPTARNETSWSPAVELDVLRRCGTRLGLGISPQPKPSVRDPALTQTLEFPCRHQASRCFGEGPGSPRSGAGPLQASSASPPPEGSRGLRCPSEVEASNFISGARGFDGLRGTRTPPLRRKMPT
ncbi:uncharacterized protein CLUP02_14730 [Colletotrichum lupini]|uniref:Uncharacterized protein n=1 Tax=Colletotrichum lupini TaxID=145971 RepID=A0A9Q8T4X2_9PEZI|nr:uncharacterized protein CLUP02_14730 [Colletotrichum lupini]UQC89202.1 hypothetical protein CLUP02_14730 [Colletotrichum lupini]